MTKKEIIKPEEGKPQINNQLTTLFKDTQEEFAKVVWPTRQQLISESIAVVLMVILVATIIYLVDNLFNWGAGKVFG